ncbi:MAG: ParA family protein [Candidatus Tectomicrobia bacterium]|nr:ParA family protein [Candidatus Tectomicrobia bacterium]
MSPGPQRVIAMVNNKGGVGKTTCTLNVAAGLARKNRRVLIVDIDPQANASLVLLGAKLFDLPCSLYDVLLESDRHIREIIIPTPISGLDLAPSQTNLANAELNLASVRGRERVLRRSMARGLEDYQYILIDCPPSLGLLTINALLAAGEVYIPIAMTYLALEGVGQVMDAIEAVKRELDHPTLSIAGVMPTFFDGRTRLSREILHSIRDHFGEVVFATAIRKNVKLDEAQSHHQSIFDYDPRSAGALEYESLVEEVIQRESTAFGREPACQTPG